ncbi:unnamed protein product [Ambrosiozyma monospora]|uniref:Unnamed protein product n=1 Tax=Ambrosiozyma monospora TaxID=43982 RepID=A0ACB5TA63_AMBMO|nr:unnamed protein product [Ambrosiozyma monospora]
MVPLPQPRPAAEDPSSSPPPQNPPDTTTSSSSLRLLATVLYDQSNETTTDATNSLINDLTTETGFAIPRSRWLRRGHQSLLERPRRVAVGSLGYNRRHRRRGCLLIKDDAQRFTPELINMLNETSKGIFGRSLPSGVVYPNNDGVVSRLFKTGELDISHAVGFGSSTVSTSTSTSTPAESPSVASTQTTSASASSASASVSAADADAENKKDK